MITRINESKTLTKYISYKHKFKFDRKKCNSNEQLNNDNVNMSIKNVMCTKKNMFEISLHVALK